MAKQPVNVQEAQGMQPPGAGPSWRVPDKAFFRRILSRPELAPVPESCAAELALHALLQDDPMANITSGALQGLQDDDARENYAVFLRLRDRVVEAGTLEAFYLGLFTENGKGLVDIPPVFIDLTVEAVVDHLLTLQPLEEDADDHEGGPQGPDAWTRRAAQMLYRRQRVTTDAGQVLSGDLQTLDMLNETGGVGDFGRFLAEAGAPMRSVQVEVLAESNAAAFLDACAADGAAAQYRFLLDLRHEVSNDLSHGLVLTMTRAHSGLSALARVLQLWVRHFLGVEVRIRPLQKIDDSTWRWHVGLDAESMLLLNDLYREEEVAPARLQRLLSLFRLEFVDAREMRSDVAGKPVYLGLMMNEQGVLQMKPQNLLVNLPLARWV